MYRNSQLFIVICLLLLVISCSDNSVSPALKALFGTYEMVRVDDKTTPFIVTETDTSTTVYVGGWLTLREDGRYEMETEVQTRIYDSGNKTTIRRLNWGEYKYQSDSLFFEPTDQDLYSNFKAHVRGKQRHRIRLWVYGAEYTFELFTVNQSFEEKSKANRIEAALQEFQLDSSMIVPINWKKWSVQ